jgi:hypothetical protein
MNKVKFAEKLERAIGNDAIRVYANSDDTLSIYCSLSNNQNAFFTIPCKIDEHDDNERRICELKDVIADFVRKTTDQFYNLSIEVACSVLE